MVVAMLALFVALTGTAVATTSALITGNQIKNSSITGADIKNKSLRPVDFRGSIRGPRGLRGLTGATGAVGAAGAAGAKGDKGDIGPTYVAANSNRATPGTIGGVTIHTLNVTLPTSGSLYIVGRVSAGISCLAAGSCSSDNALYIDDTPVPNSAMRLSAPANGSASENIVLVGVLPNVSAGPHTVKLGDTANGPWGSRSWGERAVSVVLAGGSPTTAALTTSGGVSGPTIVRNS